MQSCSGDDLFYRHVRGGTKVLIDTGGQSTASVDVIDPSRKNHKQNVSQ